MNFRERSRIADAARIDITPLVDCVFLLLIFFLLTSMFVTQPSLDIALPSASAKNLARDKKEFRVGITREGRIMHRGSEIDLLELKKRLSAVHTSAPDTLVLIEADKEAKHGRVFSVIDMAKSLGFGGLGLAGDAAPADDAELPGAK